MKNLPHWCLLGSVSATVIALFVYGCSSSDGQADSSDASQDVAPDAGTSDALNDSPADVRQDPTEDILLDVLADSVSDSTADVPTCSPPTADPELRAKIIQSLNDNWDFMAKQLEPSKIKQDHYPLYNIQAWTINALLYAELYQDTELVEKLVSLYDLAYDSLVLQTKSHYYYAPNDDGVVQREVVRDLDQPARMWTAPPPAGLSVGPETVLVASQFLYAVSRSVRIIAEMNTPSNKLQAFAKRWGPIAAEDHYRRWIRRASSAPGYFQVRGWSCGNGTFDHIEHINNLKSRRYGTDAVGATVKAKYCNAVLDVDLFIASGSAEILGANQANQTLVPLADATRTTLSKEVSAATDLFKLRHSTQTIQHKGNDYTVAVFDQGSFDDYFDMLYAGFSETSASCKACRSKCESQCPEFPGWKDPNNKIARVAPVPVKNTGWDLSHARRLPIAWDSLYRHRAVTSTTFPSKEDIAAYARQLAFRVWNGSESNPEFANYFDGTNGWYRVNYLNRPAFGYAPGMMTYHVGTCGYSFWTPLEPSLGKALDAVRAKFMSESNPIDLLMYLPEQAEASLFDDVCRKW